MEPRLQRRVQRYGWDLAACGYESLWQAQLADTQTRLLALTAPAPGERVLDVASGTGLIALAAARAVEPGGSVLGIDLSGRMVEAARCRAEKLQLPHAAFARMDAETLELPDAAFDLVLCALGLMYMPYPAQALREMRRVLKAGGRLGLAVWGERSRCGWSTLFPIVDAEVKSEVCPLFFRLGQQNSLAQLCAESGFDAVELRRVPATLEYGDADQACDAAFIGGPVALAWSRLGDEARARVRARYLEAIEPWRHGNRYSVPSEFVLVTAAAAN